jgi:hypothetical protein
MHAQPDTQRPASSSAPRAVPPSAPRPLHLHRASSARTESGTVPVPPALPSLQSPVTPREQALGETLGLLQQMAHQRQRQLRVADLPDYSRPVPVGMHRVLRHLGQAIDNALTPRLARPQGPDTREALHDECVRARDARVRQQPPQLGGVRRAPAPIHPPERGQR